MIFARFIYFVLIAQQRLAEEQQLKLEQQHLSMSKLYRQMDHVLKFASWAVSTDNSTALLLCKKLVL